MGWRFPSAFFYSSCGLFGSAAPSQATYSICASYAIGVARLMAELFIDHSNQKGLIWVVFFFSWRDRIGAGLTFNFLRQLVEQLSIL